MDTRPARSLALFLFLFAGQHLTALHASDALTITWDTTPFRAGGAKGFTELANGDLLASRTQIRKGSTSLLCSTSSDGGRTWRDLSTLAKEERPDMDMGDGSLLASKDGTLYYSYRNNRTDHTNHTLHYQLKVAVSHDQGKHWSPHSTVKEVNVPQGETRGLWSSYLHQRRDGALLCFYDDEDEAWRAGFKRHQWLMMKQWDEGSLSWSSPVIVSRAADPGQLSRDGMPSVVERSNGELLCALESVSEERPHWNVIRLVRSSDGGRTWDWQTKGRPLIYRPRNKGFSAVSPWLSSLDSGILLCAFATDEDRPVPDQPGSQVKAMNRDIKVVFSLDNGDSWTQQAMNVVTNTHKTYMPQMLQLRHPRHGKSLLCLYLDTTLGFQGIQGLLHAKDRAPTPAVKK